MADGVVLNAGTGGSTVLTDDTGATGHAQVVKLAISTDGSPTLIPAEATNGLDVDVTRVQGTVTVQSNAANLATEASLSALAGDVGDTADAAATAGSTGTLHAKQRLMTSQLDAIQTAVELLDNAVRAEDEASAGGHSGLVVLARRTDTPAAQSGTDGDYEFLQVVGGRLAATSVVTGTVTVDGSGVTQPVSHAALTELAAAIDTEVQVDIVGSLPAGTNNIGDVDILSIAAGDNNIGNVDIVSLPASTNTLEVVGDVAHDAAAAGNPILIAGIAQDIDDTAPPNRVSAEADATRLAMSRDGAVFAHPHGPQVWSYHDDDTAAVTTDGTVHAAPGAGLSLYVTDIVFSIGAATASSIFLEESTTKVLGPYYLEAVAGRSLHIRFATPKKITANTALLVTNTGSISFSVDITGFTAQG